MVEFAGGIIECRDEVLTLEIRHLRQDLFSAETRREKIKNIDHSNSHTSDTRTASAFVRVDRYPFQIRVHHDDYAIGEAKIGEILLLWQFG